MKPGAKLKKKKKPKPRGYWTIKRIKDSAKKFKFVKDWYENEFGAYVAASNLKILPEVTKNLKKEIVANNYWNADTIKEAIKDFKTFRQWFLEDPKSYWAARRRDLLDDDKITGHLGEKQPIKWNKKAIIKDALLYKTRTDWVRSSPGAYRAAKIKGYFDEAAAHIKLQGNRFRRCLYSIEIAGKNKIYIGLSQKFKTRIKAHLKSKRFKKYKKKELIIKQLTEYIDRTKAADLEIKLIQQKKNEGFELLNKIEGGGLGGMYLEWPKDKVLESARKEKHKVRWKENGAGAYNAAIRGGYFKEATAHMELLTPRGKWLKKEDVLAEAKKYKHKRDFWNKASGAVTAAKKNGWYEEATAHMTKPYRMKRDNCES